MILIEKGKEPASLLAYRKQKGACYAELPKTVADDLRRQMWEEQRGLCAYCTCKIEKPDMVRIEHYRPRHTGSSRAEADDALLYKNMLAVCHGNSLTKGTSHESTTCDAHKGNQLLAIDLQDKNSIRKIIYTSDGYITSEDADIKRDVEDTLNLNCHARSLPENRKIVLQKAKSQNAKQCQRKGAGNDTYKALCSKLYRRYTEQKQLEPYCGIVIAWLEKKLKKI